MRTFLLVLFCYLAVGVQAQPLPVIPQPQQVTYRESTLPLTALGGIVATGEDTTTVAVLQEAFREAGYALERREAPVGVRLRPPEEDERAQLDMPHADEAYILQVSSSGIDIVGATPRARFYGAMTLVQLLRSHPDTLRGLDILDYPAYGIRGVSDDISRGQVSTMEDFQRIIRFLAEHKMNVYMPYIEDVFRFRRYPDIGRGRGALTAEEWKALQDYARRYFVEVIPIFQTLGHFENILNMDPYVKYAEYPGASSLNPQDPEAFAFLTSLLDEVVPAFDSPYFHMGADESWDIGLGASRAAAQRYGTGTVHALHYRKVYEYLKQRGKKVMMYGDMLLRHPDILAQIPKDIIVVDWHYNVSDRYPSAEVFAHAGQPFIVSPGIQNWNRLYPDQAAAWLNICNFSREGVRTGALGVITSNWGDFGGPNFRALNYRGYAYGAECSWNPLEADGASIDGRFNRTFYGTDAPELHTVQALMTEMTRTLSFRAFWRHPERVRQDWKHETLIHTQLLQGHAAAIREAIAAVQPRLKRHAEYLDYHRLMADFFDWKARTVALVQWLDLVRWLHIQPEDRRTLIDTGIRRLDTLVAAVAPLRRRYRELWLRTNRPDNLERLLRLMDYQRAYLEDIRERLQQNRWEVTHTLPGAFITTADMPEHTAPTTAYLRYRFHTAQPVRRAMLQLIGDSHAQVWLDGRWIGEVRATRTLSLLVEMQRVLAREVTDVLAPGSMHVLAVKVTSYQDERPASAHVLLELTYEDGSVERITTDRYWKGHLAPAEGWEQPAYDDSFWLPAREVSFFQRVGPPLLLKGFPARIEF